MNIIGSFPKAVHVEGVSARYQALLVLRDISFTLPAGEILALLGPSGCGKSTLLRSIAGFVCHSGDIKVGDQNLSHVPPHRRNIGMVFQDYSLFPHMTVGENVAFGLNMRRTARSEITERVAEALALVGLEGFEARMARQLSGGQQQRVALARALVIRPQILLLDEPLSALDKKLREEMRIELKRVQRLTNVTTIFVTHDQEEALGLADRLALMHGGTVLQTGTPEEVYRHPATPFVAEFLGAANSARAICRSVDGDLAALELPGAGHLRSLIPKGSLHIGADATILVRPERITLSRDEGPSAYLSLPSTVLGRTYLGRYMEVVLQLADGRVWTAAISDEAKFHMAEPGAKVSIEVDPRNVFAYEISDPLSDVSA